MSESLLGRKIGHFRIVDKIATGGMGEVYAGFDETLQRKVALKRIRPDYLDEEAKGRFLREARVLSQLGHPNICQIFDYLEGEASDFIVMELVQGQSLGQAMKHGLDARLRMKVAEQVAGALVAAHEKGVIHRDLKPENVMLTEAGEVKVLDFGLSRHLEEEGSLGLVGEGAALPGLPALPPEEDVTLGLVGTGVSKGSSGPRPSLTTFGTLMGTLGYMSPEQARCEEATSASDLYSFGLILQELFTGHPPHEPGLKASVRLERAKAGETLPVRGVDPDLATLIGRLKAVEPAARPSAVDVAEKLDWIRHKPQRRRRRWLLASALVLLGLFGAAMTVETVRMTRAERRARLEAETAKQVSGFLVDLFKVSDPGEARGKTVTAREILDKGASRVQTGLQGQPLVQARLQHTMGEVYLGLGLYHEAEPLFVSALALREKALGPAHLDVAESLQDLADLDTSLERFSQAEANYRRALALREKALGPDHPDVARSLVNLAVLLRHEGRYSEAEPLYLRALAIHEKAPGPESAEVANNLNDLAVLYGNEGRFADAEPLLRRALAVEEATLGPDHPDVAQTVNNLAVLCMTQGHYAEAEPLLLRSLALRERLLGPDHLKVAIALNNLANMYAKQGRNAEAEPLYLRALAIKEKALGPRSKEAAVALHALATCELKLGQLEPARAHATRALDIARERVAKTPSDRDAASFLGSVLNHRGEISVALGKPDQARAAWTEGLAVFKPLAQDLKNPDDQCVYAELLLHLDRLDDARPLVETLYARGYRNPNLDALCREKGLALKP